jgi:predicted NBD/HSP70 family sugar kinase
MMMIGLEMDDARVTAVAVDDTGRVQTRASGAGGDLAPAARGALLQVMGGTPGPHPVGVASSTPDSPVVIAALAALMSDFKGLPPAEALTSSGAAAAVAEAWTGAAKGLQDVVYFGVGERTAGGITRGGAPVTGARGRAASVAWLALNPVEREDYRKAGCLEAEVAAAGIVRRLIWRIKAGDHSRVQDAVANDLGAITIEHVFDAARQGDGVSISVVRDTAKYLGMAAANLVVIADPESLVLGGIMASAADLFYEAVRVEAGRRLPRQMLDALTIAPAVLGDDAPAIGAARLGSGGR